MKTDLKVLVTGADGFIGKNFVAKARELSWLDVAGFTRSDTRSDLLELVRDCDAVLHLAGENRPSDVEAFDLVNRGLTEELVSCAVECREKDGRARPIMLASSTQAAIDNPYGRSKRAAEIAVQTMTEESGNPASIYRLPGVFGKWSRPNYNSVVSTFCHRVANDLPIQINDPDGRLSLVHIDDVIESFIATLCDHADGCRSVDVAPVYSTTVGQLAEAIEGFRASRESLVIDRVGQGFQRALYSTYVSYLPKERFAYEVPSYADERGVFVEMLKTHDSGQMSFFTAPPGITRGEHYHHTKTEKFLVIKGSARFAYRNILTHEQYTIDTSGAEARIVETVPGWAHNITNIGDEEMIVMLWANEIFDREKPDTYACKV